MCQRKRIFATSIRTFLKPLEAIDQDRVQRFVRDSVDTMLFDWAILERNRNSFRDIVLPLDNDFIFVASTALWRRLVDAVDLFDLPHFVVMFAPRFLGSY